jgi:hypothetical protein
MDELVRATSDATNRCLRHWRHPGCGNLIVPSLAPSGLGNSGVAIPGFAFAHPRLLSSAPPAQCTSQTIVRPTITETCGPRDPGSGNLIVPSLAPPGLGNSGVAIPGFAFAPPAQSVSQTIVGRSVTRVPGIWTRKRAAQEGPERIAPGERQRTRGQRPELISSPEGARERRTAS